MKKKLELQEHAAKELAAVAAGAADNADALSTHSVAFSLDSSCCSSRDTEDILEGAANAAVPGVLVLPQQDEQQEQQDTFKLQKQQPPAQLTQQQQDDSMRLKTKEMSEKRKASNNKGSTIISKDEAVQGSIAGHLYMYYLRTGGLCVFIAVMLAMSVSQGFTLLSSFWLSEWGTANEATEDGLSSGKNMYYVGVFAGLSFLAIACYTIRSLLLAKHRVQVATSLHCSLLQSVVSGSCNFFDITPAGRLLNKFSSDFQIVDEELAQTLNQVVSSLATCVGAVVAIAGATKGVLLVLIMPLLHVYNKLQR
jgi:hypothetical protein